MSFIRNLFPYHKAVDQVQVMDVNGNQVFRNARPVKATVKENSRSMEHPVETGAVVTDHRIILPIEIELSLILASNDYQQVYSVIRNLYLNATLLTVQTKAGVYTNQFITDMPHEEDPEMYQALTIALKLKQVLFTTSFSQAFMPENPVDASTVNKGQQQPTTPTAAQAQQGLTTAQIMFRPALGIT